LITDEFTEETFQVVQSVLTNNTTKLEIMPFGTSAGATVPALGSKRSIKDNKGNSVFSALNQEIINKLGSLEQVNINSLTLDKSDVQLLAKTIVKI
jgi:hypothetical protein